MSGPRWPTTVAIFVACVVGTLMIDLFMIRLVGAEVDTRDMITRRAAIVGLVMGVVWLVGGRRRRR